MEIDNYKKNLTSEQKLGKYNVLTIFFKIVSIFFVFIIQLFCIHLLLKSDYIKIIVILLDIVSIIHLMKYSIKKEYKRNWIVIILLFPILGFLIYWIFGNNTLSKEKIKKLNSIEERNKKIIGKSNFVDNLKLKQFEKYSRYKAYKNQGIEYFGHGEELFEDLKSELKNAKKSILIEMYIISKGKLLDEILNILDMKIKDGVDVEIIYDSFGSMFKIPKKIKNKILNSGIKLYEYSKFTLDISGYMNHRDHKKIIVIDGKIAYTGGINISDEYVNKKELYGYWKDSGIKLYGNIVLSYLLMYLKVREEITNENIDYNRYILNKDYVESNEGWNFSFSDGPDNLKNTIENVLINVIQNSKEYLYITTPYFMPSKIILNSVIDAAKRGVNVVLLTPYIADKKIVEFTNRSYYDKLLENGVKIYEYKYGFIHSKELVSDEISIIGTINLDYKSLYFNYECANLSYKTGIEKKIKKEFENTLKESIFIDEEKFKKRSIIQKIEEKVAYFLSPLF